MISLMRERQSTLCGRSDLPCAGETIHPMREKRSPLCGRDDPPYAVKVIHRYRFLNIIFIFYFMNKLYLFLTCLLCLASTNLFAVPAIPYPVDITQPDGTSLTIRLHGDEYFNYATTEDGYMVVKDPRGFYVYAQVLKNGQIEPTERIARNTTERSAVDAGFLGSLDARSEIERYYNAATISPKQMQRAAPGQEMQSQPQRTPKTGAPKFLVLLVEFSDRQFTNRTTANTRFSNLLNEQGYSDNGSTGSVKDYYIANSYGQFTPNYVVVGPVTLPNTAQYYCDNDGALVPQMVIDACNAADPTVNFAEYDNDGDNRVDNVLCFVAGWDRAQGADNATNVWSHRWSVYPTAEYQGGNYSGSVASTYFDSKRVFDYFVTSELRGASGTNMSNIGTFVHEFAHILGLPDYYHTQTSSKTTLQYWSAMDQGNYCNTSRTPPLFSAYDRFFLGWLTPEQYASGQRTLYPLSQSGTAAQAGQAYLIAASSHNMNGGSPSPSEFFVVEYREKTGWDAYLGNNSTSGSGGMLFWHIDYSSSVWSNNVVNNYTGTTQTQASHMRVYLEPTNGLSQTTPGGAFTSGNFTPKLWNGTSLAPVVSIIKNGTTSMSFGADVPETPTAFTVTPDAGGALSAALQWTNPTLTTSGQPVTLTKVEVYRDALLIYTNNSPVAGAADNYTDNSPTNDWHTYTVYAYNSAGVSAPATASAFVGIDPCAITTFPWTEGFNATNSTNPYLPDNCWDAESVGSYYWKRVTLGTYPSITTREGAGMLQYNCYSYPPNSKGKLITPPFNTKNKTLKFSFYMYRDGQYIPNRDSLNIYVSPTKNITDATLVRTVYRNRTLASLTTSTQATNAWYQYEDILPTTGLSSAYIIMEGVSQYGNDIYVDNIEVTACQTYNDTENVSVCSGSNYTFPDNTEIFNITSPTSHTSYLTSVAGCDSTVVTNIGIKSANVSVTLMGYTLTANQADASYRWLDCNTGNAPIAEAVLQDYTPGVNGYYAVEITYNGCIFVSDCVNVLITDIDMVKNNHIVIFPNPAKDVAYINLLPLGSRAKATITDISGRTIDTFTVEPDTPFRRIDVSSYPPGAYIVRIISSEINLVERLVVK